LREDLGVEYLTVKALTSRPLSIEDDLKAVLAQYTGDETVLELFQATKLSRYLPGKPLNPSPVEVAAYRYVADIIGRLEPYAGGPGSAILGAYRTILLIHDVELIIARLLRRERLPEEGELILPHAPEIARARRAAEEEATPQSVLSAAGLTLASRLASEKTEMSSVALDVEALKAFEKALGAVKLDITRELLGARLDMLAARIAYTLVSSEAPREVAEEYSKALVGYRLPAEKLRDIIETRDREGLEALLKSRAPQAIEGLAPLEAFIAAVRKHSRALLPRAYIEAILAPDVVVPPLEQAMLDAEDAIAIAIAGFSRQPKTILLQMVSIAG